MPALRSVIAPALAPALACVLLAACAAELPAPPAPPPADACGAAARQGLVGRPEAVLAAMTFPAPVRIIRPGDMVTLDYVAERLNIRIGPDGRIAAVDCG